MKWVIAVILGHLNDRQRLFGSSMPRRVRCSQCGRAILQLGIFGSGEYSSKCLTMVIFSLVAIDPNFEYHSWLGPRSFSIWDIFRG